MIRRVSAMYFSPTGTTRRVVSTIASGIVAEAGGWGTGDVVDLTPPGVRSRPLSFSADDLLVAGVPVYAGRVPNVLLPFFDSITGNGASAVAVVLYGNRGYDDALVELADILAARGFKVLAAGAFIGQHSFSETLGAGRPDASDLAVADAFARSIPALTRVPESISPSAIPGNRPYRAYYVPRRESGEPVTGFRKIKPTTDASCTRCGACAAACPMGSIATDDYSSISGICIKCCACVKACPTGAKRFDDPDFVAHRRELERGCEHRRSPEVIL